MGMVVIGYEEEFPNAHDESNAGRRPVMRRIRQGMGRKVKRVKEPRKQYLKAVTSSLFFITFFVIVFIILFSGAFDRPGQGSVADTSKNLISTDLRLPALGDGGKEDSSASAGIGLDELVPGDILLGRCRMSFVPSLNPHNGWTHAALYIGHNTLIVASTPRTGVRTENLKSWTYPKMTWVVYLRVSTADEETRLKAVEFAKDKKGQAYDLNWLGKQGDGGSWYCSELPWAAYLYASGGSIDLARWPAWFGVSPDDIFMSDDTVVIGGHYEKKPDTVYSLVLKVLALCVLAAGGGILAPHLLIFGMR